MIHAPPKPAPRPISTPATSSKTMIAGEDERPVLGRGAAGDQRHQDDGGGVVEPGLRLEGAGDPPRQRHHPDHREHCGRVGRRRHRAEEYGELPRHAEQVVGADRDHADRDRHPDRRQREAEPDRAPGLPPVRGDATLGQDDREGAEPERVRDLGVLEGDADQGLPEHARRSAGRRGGSGARRGRRPAPRAPRRG